MKRQNLWRLRQIVMDEELVGRICDWHGGQSTALYALCSTGRSHLVSLSMIDEALRELRSTRRTTGFSRKDRRDLDDVIWDLESERMYWKESTAKAAGMEKHDEGYDTRDYGYDPEEEEDAVTYQT
jgi:hypothetical protein